MGNQSLLLLNKFQQVLFYVFILDIISSEHTFSNGQGSYELKAVIFHIGYTTERGHYTVATLSPESSGGEVLYFDGTNVFQFGGQTETCWEDLFSSHKPFDVRSSQFRPLKPQPSGKVKSGSSVGDQPRTPYILVYASSFQQRKK